MAREIWTADCETAPFGDHDWHSLVEHHIRAEDFPFIWGCYNGGEYHQFQNTVDFIDFISSRECIVYAHNGGKFDWHFVFAYLDTFEPLMVIAGRVAKFKIGDAEFRDSYNILPMPLSAWQKDDFDYELLKKENRHQPQNWKKICDYLRHDCIYLYEMVSAYIERYGLNLTQAGAALKFWQKQSGVKACETDSGFYADFAPYYYGGRVQCFQTGLIHDPFTVIDINSAYPMAMTEMHPWGKTYHVTNTLPRSRGYLQRSFIHLSGVSDGAFPYRTKAGLDFPSDTLRREYWVSGWEFLAAIETHTLTDWEVISCTTFGDSIEFSDYVSHFYAQKNEAKAAGDKASYLFAKLFLNSLYGKFAANPEKYEEFTVVEPRHIQAAMQDGYNFCAELDQWALMSKPLDESKHRFYNVATAASITGYVRAMLWRAINECGRNSVLYCDTDSLSILDTGRLPTCGDQLGQWDIEARCTFGAIAGKKLYAFRNDQDRWKTASKGVRLSHDEICRVAAGETITHVPDTPTFSVKKGIYFNPRKITKIA